MFKNQYQGGPFVEIFSAQGKNPGAKWKIFGNPSAIRKEYDKEIKGFVFVLKGSSRINKMQLPKDNKQTLGLIQQFLTLQIFLLLGQDFSTELLITDLGNIKRRLYLSTVHKELSVTALHAKIPLFTVKREIWCNMCIDLVAFTSEIFRGAVFQSLDGIIISANCKLRKIFTLKSKPQDTTEEGACSVPFVPYEPTDVIPRTCQLNTDVLQLTQLLNLTKIHKAEMKYRSPVKVPETDGFTSRRQSNTCRGKTQDKSHIAFGSKILGPPPSSSRRVSIGVSGEVTKTWSSKSSRPCRLPISKKGTEPIPDVERLELSFSKCNDSLDQGGERDTHQTTEDICQNDEWVFPERLTKSMQVAGSEQFIATGDSTCHNLTLPQNASVEHHSNEKGAHQVNNEEIFTFSSSPRSALYGKSPSMSPESCIFPLDLKQDSNGVHRKTQIEDNFQGTDSSEEDDNNEFILDTESLEISSSRETSDSAVFKEIPLKRMSWRNEYWKKKGQSKHNLEELILSKTPCSTVRKTHSVGSQSSIKPTLSLSPAGSKSEFSKVILNGSEKMGSYEEVSGQLKRPASKMSHKKISRENSGTCDYQSNRLSSSELQMLTSMKRQQNEGLQDTGISHGLSASQIENCSVSISATSDHDKATWNSCLPPPINQEHDYQKQMSPLSHSNPWDWLNILSPPVIPGSQQLEEHTKSSANQSIPGEVDNTEEDEEMLTLLYDPCLNCYFDPSSGKYYELA